MSRCLPFPPPGYERKLVVPEEVMVESIKREQELAKHAKKARRKEKKREKKEKKEKKKKSKPIIEQNYSSHKKRLRDEECNADYRADHGKKREDEGEPLEKSSLTEEHGMPASVLNHCDSSDSTQSSSKRQKHSFLSDSSHNQSTVLRFRLPLLKPKGSSGEERQCSTSECVEINAHKKGDVAPRLTKEQSCSTSKRIEIPAQDVVESAAKSSSFGSGSPDLDVQLRDLIENWVPPPIQIERTDSDDQEWLFNVSHRHEAKRYKASSGGTRENCSKAGDDALNGSFSFWPLARYLPEADIYALPYTVPY